jgi:hypothetical protein
MHVGVNTDEQLIAIRSLQFPRGLLTQKGSVKLASRDIRRVSHPAKRVAIEQ